MSAELPRSGRVDPDPSWFNKELSAQWASLERETSNQPKDVASAPGLLLDAVRLVRKAAPHRFAVLVGLRLFGAMLALPLILGTKEVFESEKSLGEGSVLTAVLVTVGIASVALSVSLSEHQGQLMTAAVQRLTAGRLLDATTAAQLRAFDVAAFYDSVQRTQAFALVQPVLVVNATLGLISGIPGLLLVLVSLVVVQPLLVPIIAVGCLPLGLLGLLASRREYAFAVQRTLGDRQRHYLQGVLTGRDEAKEVRAFGYGKALRAEFDRLYDDHFELLRRQSLTRTVLAMTQATFTGLVAIAWVGTVWWLHSRHWISTGDLSAAVVGALMLVVRIGSVSRGLTSLYQSSLFLADFEKLRVDSRPPVTSSAPVLVSDTAPHIVLEHVTFTYPGSKEPTLCDINIDIPAGSVIAIVGENGSGKTTLAKLLAHLYEPISGRILWDGQATSLADADALRGSTSVVFQDFIRYELPARLNVGLGRYEVMDRLDVVRDAARLTGVDGLLDGLPEGYDTYLSQAFPGGVNLSLGQWQRVALARAFLRDAPFLILDEPAASLDPRAEHALYEQVRALQRGRTVVMISHRLWSVRHADQIVVLESGRVSEVGTHPELIERGGLYAELFELQAAPFLDAQDRGTT